ncbi:MAG: ABC transporter ATP-binding protein, partial [Flavobacteriales bacterium]
LRAAFISFIVFGVFGSIVAVVWYGVRLIQTGELTVGQLTEFLLLTVFIAASLGSLGNLYAQFQKAVGAADKLMTMLDEEQEDLDPKKTIETPFSGTIELKNIHFSYPSRADVEVLKGLDLNIKAGERIAIVGGSGAGKSTLAALLYQFYEPNSGKIAFDGLPACQMNLSQIRQQMALVPQELILFGGSIRENIAYGNPDASFDAIKQAAEQAYATEFIEKFPDGFDTLVGERGVQLSGGQKQRIAIARAILKDPKILILDEATSALDSESETVVQKALEEVMKNRTSISIAHRLSTVKMADRLVVMHQGTIVELGKHDELMAIEDGFFKNMKDLQT